MEQGTAAILLIHCKDQKGIVARVAGFIHDFGGNILDSDHHTDRETGDFLMRTVFDLDGFQIPREEIASSFAPIAIEDIEKGTFFFFIGKGKNG